MIRLGFDIGGTFTDFVLLDERTGKSHFAKIPSTPLDPEKAVLDGLDQLMKEYAVSAADVTDILHATTVATNAVLERKGSRTALATTEGFRDVLILGRQKRSETNNLHILKPQPLVARRDIFEVAERVDASGKVLRPVDEGQLAGVVEALRAGGYEAVAVVFLHAYANAAHEEAVRAAIEAALPDVCVSVSHEVSPKYREYERTSTTVANAYVQPIVARYVDRLNQALSGRGIERDLFIMQSNGGLVSPRMARDFPIRIVESGPAAGVLMCAMVGAQEGYDHVLTFDMGGTTAKLGAIDDGEPAIMPTFEVDAVNYRKNSGLPLNISAVELLEIGAGGGSIASASNGLIKVGPDSAGAVPGPICYRRGGAQPTITDANLVLGYLDPRNFNNGRMQLDAEGAAAGIERDIAGPLGIGLAEAAWGVHALATNNMERAMRIVSIERGRDPRHYAMVAFGGAGPLHAARLARAVGIPTLIVPVGAGVGSAIGLLTAARKVDMSMTRVIRLLPENADEIAAIFAELKRRVEAEVHAETSGARVTWKRGAYLRYAGQGYELRVELADGAVDAAFVADSVAKFHARYQRQYGYHDAHSQVEAIDWFMIAVIEEDDGDGRVSAMQFEPLAGDPVVGERSAYFAECGGYAPAKVIDRYRIRPGVEIRGPALIEERESTTVILPGDVATVSARGHLVISINSQP